MQQKLEWRISKYRILSGISFYKLCFLKQHRSISASLAFLKIILLIALLTFKFCYRRQVWCSQNVLSMPHQYLHLLLHIILVRPDMLQEVLVTECPQMLRLWGYAPFLGILDSFHIFLPVDLSCDFNSVFFVQFRGLEQYSKCDRPTERYGACFKPIWSYGMKELHYPKVCVFWPCVITGSMFCSNWCQWQTS